MTRDLVKTDIRKVHAMPSTEVGTAVVKVLPDLADFDRILQAVPAAGLTLREVVEYQYSAGEIVKQIKTTTIVKASA